MSVEQQEQAQTEQPTQAASEVDVNVANAATAPNESSNDFAAQAAEEQPSLVAEFIDFLLHNKKWWLTPIILVLLLAGLLAFFGGSGSVVAPFIYPIW